MNKFYKTDFKITILSEEPVGNFDLNYIENEVTFGQMVLHTFNVTKSKVISGKQMANLLYDAGSEPGFFQLDDKGNQIEI